MGGQSRQQPEWRVRVQGGASLALVMPLPWSYLLQQSLRTRKLQAGREEVLAVKGQGKARRLHKATCMTLRRWALQQVQAKGPTPRLSAVAQGV